MKIEVFHMINYETGKNTYVATRALRERCAQTMHKVHMAPIDADVLMRMIEGNAVDLKKVLAMPEVCCREPIILIRLGTSEPPVVMIADGHHRYWRAAAALKRTIPAYLIEEVEWRQFEVPGPQFTREEHRARAPGTRVQLCPAMK